MSKRVLDINDLNVGFSSYGETTKIVTDVSFHIDEGETVGIVGESCLLYTSDAADEL